MNKKLLIFFSLLFIGSCTIGSSQFGAIFGDKKKQGVEEAYWMAEFNGVKYQLIAINLPNSVLFSDRFGNSVLFDGCKALRGEIWVEFDPPIFPPFISIRLAFVLRGVKFVLNNENIHAIFSECFKGSFNCLRYSIWFWCWYLLGEVTF